MNPIVAVAYVALIWLIFGLAANLAIFGSKRVFVRDIRHTVTNVSREPACARFDEDELFAICTTIFLVAWPLILIGAWKGKYPMSESSR